MGESKSFLITGALLDVIGNYLGKQPYEQTYKLIAALQEEIKPQLAPAVQVDQPVEPIVAD